MRVIVTRIEELPINKRIIELIQSTGVKELFPPQQEAFKTKVMDGKNLVLAIPTSSGKTLVSEICMLKTILEGRGKALYLVPLRSLAHEKYAEFKRYEQLGITTAMSIGDYDSSGTRLGDADIVVLTTERADSLIRHRVEWMREVGIIVVDEVHLVNDSSRGPTLEMVLAKLMRTLPDVQTVALSATISNAIDIAGWLDAALVKSSWRPVPLNEGVYFDGKIIFSNNSSRIIKRTRQDDLANIVCDILDEDGQVLIFVSSRRYTVSAAKKIASSVRAYLSEETKEALMKVATRIGGGRSTPETSKTLARLVSMGVAFHHAGLSNQERSSIEDCFKKTHLKVIVATPTLAAGVNLPARRVIIRDYRRYESGRGSYPIPILEYKQMAGRAGRPKYDKYGEAVLIARSEEEYDSLLEHYIHAEPEAITSKLASPIALRSHILASIAGGLAATRDELNELISGTFFSFQFDQFHIEDHVSSALTFLQQGGLVTSDSQNVLKATLLGQRASKLYIDPQTAILFRDALQEIKDPSIQSFLHLICHSPDQPVTYVTRSEYEDYEIFLSDNKDEFLIEPPDSWENPEKYTEYLGEIKTTHMLLDWISERTDKDITDQYNVGVGDIHRYVQSATWLLYSASEVARVIEVSEHVPTLRKLMSRMKHGVKEELMELVGLRGVGRVRGRMLHNHGLRSLADIHSADPIELARIPTIGTTLAKTILKQLGVDVDTIQVTEEQQTTTTDTDQSDMVQANLDEFED